MGQRARAANTAALSLGILIPCSHPIRHLTAVDELYETDDLVRNVEFFQRSDLAGGQSHIHRRNRVV